MAGKANSLKGKSVLVEHDIFSAYFDQIMFESPNTEWGRKGSMYNIKLFPFQVDLINEITKGTLPMKMFPLQTQRLPCQPGPLEIPWSIAEKAYGAYVREYGRCQSLERIAERGGFGWGEMDMLYPAWREEVSEIVLLRKVLDKALSYICHIDGYVRPDTIEEWIEECLAEEESDPL